MSAARAKSKTVARRTQAVRQASEPEQAAGSDGLARVGRAIAIAASIELYIDACRVKFEGGNMSAFFFALHMWASKDKRMPAWIRDRAAEIALGITTGTFDGAEQITGPVKGAKIINKAFKMWERSNDIFYEIEHLRKMGKSVEDACGEIAEREQFGDLSTDRITTIYKEQVRSRRHKTR